MDGDSAKKACKMCCMEIPREARKCPYCQHFQRRSALFLYHPGFATVLAGLPMFALWFFLAQLFHRGEDYEQYKDQISITESEAVFGESKSGGTVGVIGMISNKSSVPWTDVRFHVEFFDSAGKRVDVAQRGQYEFHLPPRGTLSFKVSFGREFPQSNYVKHSVHIASAKDARAKW
jgi:hypothetical protein